MCAAQLDVRPTAGPPVSETVMPAIELIQHHGYQVEEHTVQTADGYILTHFRIPSGTKKGPPVLLQHGLFCSSEMWIISGREQSLAFILADAGYDVWLSNIRGTKYSQAHVNLSTDYKNFWEFSFHEMGYYDVPATIDYITATTQQPQVYYIGHSMGNTMLYVMTSTKPEYNEKIKIAINLSPVVYLGQISHPFMKLLLPFVPLIKFLLDEIGFWHIPYFELQLTSYLDSFCQEGTPTIKWCTLLAIVGFGGDHQNMNKALLPTFISHSFAGTSVQTLEHYGQLANSNGFQRFDYGPEKNLELYGQREPLEYNIKNTTIPVGFYNGDGDLFISPEDFDKITGVLQKNTVAKIRVPHRDFGHMDFILAKNVKELVYDSVLAFLRVY